jgi:hypothetical protein
MPSLARLAASPLLALALAAGCAESGSRLAATSESGATTATATAVGMARFEAILYQVDVAPDRLADLDARAIEAKAATAKDFEAALAALGKVKLLQKVDQSVNLAGDTIRLSDDVPVVTASRRDRDTGAVLQSITYQSVGAVFFFASVPPAPGSATKAPAVSLDVDLAAVHETPVEIVQGKNASASSRMMFSQSGPVHYGRPSVAISVFDASAGAAPMPRALAMWYVFRRNP